MAKRGRPTKATTVAPPGKRYCAYKDHFTHLVDFRGKDSYCAPCRKEYNALYHASKPKIDRPDLEEVRLRVYCNNCDSLIDITAYNTTESGTWICPECDHEYEGSIRINLRSKHLT
jgi:hypothetical protein